MSKCTKGVYLGLCPVCGIEHTEIAPAPLETMSAEAILPSGRRWRGNLAELSEYLLYHMQVVDDCVRLTAEKHRVFYDSMDYSEEWKTGEPADETAQANVDATDWE